MDDMLREYLPILVFLAVAIGLGLVLILAAVVLAVRNPD
ncbi:MAG: NADH-quinone oxidoreductase subunit A, partial [Sulfitobacter geojensis]